MPLHIQIITGPIHGAPVYIESAMGSPALYDTGALACAEVELRRRILPPDSPVRYRIVKAESEDDSSSAPWRSRERERFESGFYAPVPWANESWFKESPHYDSHYCHLSRDKSAMVAFTESDSKGAEDKQKRMRAGRYLTRYFGVESRVARTIDDIEIRYWAGKLSIAVGESGAVCFATSPEDIEEVYTSGPESCMSHEASHYAGPCHPTRVYGAGDFAVAYIEHRSSIAARCITWPEKKVYGRVYGDGGVWSERLREHLNDQGFRYSCQSEDWDGARLLRVEVPNDDGFVIPYFDIPGCATDCGDFLRVKRNGEIDAGNESGVSENVGRACDNCSDRYDDENCGGFIESTEQNLCDSCYSEQAFYCDDCNTTCHIEDSHHIDGIDRYVCDSCSENYPTCDSCGESNTEDSSQYVESMNRTFCESCFPDKCSTCDECGDSHSSDSFVGDINGDSICESCAESKVECIECHKYDETSECFVDSDGDSWCGDCRQSCLEFTEKESE